MNGAAFGTGLSGTILFPAPDATTTQGQVQSQVIKTVALFMVCFAYKT